jgi:hypothetical protein
VKSAFPSGPNPPAAAVWIQAGRWVPLLVLLSLDAVRSFWPSMGLSRPREEQDAWVSLLRRAILGGAEHQWARPGAPSTFVLDTLAAVEAEFGAAACLALIKLGRFTFAMGPGDHPELFAWHDILARCTEEPGGVRTLVPWDDLQVPFTEGLERARAAVVRPEIRLPLSSWDVAMLALRKVDDVDRDAPEHPMRLVELTSRAASARAFWREILPLLDAERRDALAWNGTRLGWSLGALSREDMLPDPTTLVEVEHA